MNLLKICQFKTGVCLVILSVWVWASPASAQWSKQTVSLNLGWNAIYLQVEPVDSSCETVFAGWPVSSVSLYNMERTAAQYFLNPSEPQDATAEYLTWIPGQPAGAHALNSVLAGHAYLIYATAACQRDLTGRPAVPRIEWLPGTNALNLVGFRPNPTAKFGTFLTGAGFNVTKTSIYSLSGTNHTSPTISNVGGFSGSYGTVSMDPGKAYFIACDKVSTFSGPVKVYPAGTDGLFFQTNNSSQFLRLKNESGASLTVTLALTNSAPSPSNVVPVLPTLQYFDALSGWLSLTSGVQKTLLAAEDWTLPLILCRTNMVEGNLYGGVVICSDTAGGRVEVPLEAAYHTPDPTKAQWPAGLWVGTARLNKVSQVLGQHAINDGATAGGIMEFRLILHVGLDGNCRLLQRVLIAGTTETNGTWNPALYVNEKDVPVGMKTVRISAAAFGLKNNIKLDETFGGMGGSRFGNRLMFTYAIADDDSVNPFRHPYHPDHDGLKADFATKSPSGDNPDNYIGEIKPELFSISNTVSLVWTNATAASGPSAHWTPSETTSGDIRFQVEGIRKEGPLLMQGPFELRRISQVGVLSTE